jgi:hypothetical protein
MEANSQVIWESSSFCRAVAQPLARMIISPCAGQAHNHKKGGMSMIHVSEKLRGRVSAVTLVVGVLSGTAAAAIISVVPASALQYSVMVQTETPEWSPGGSPNPPAISKGTTVVMECWTEGPNTDGSKKWFLVQNGIAPNNEGYVPANSVGNQAQVPPC